MKNLNWLEQSHTAAELKQLRLTARKNAITIVAARQKPWVRQIFWLGVLSFSLATLLLVTFNRDFIPVVGTVSFVEMVFIFFTSRLILKNCQTEYEKLLNQSYVGKLTSAVITDCSGSVSGPGMTSSFLMPQIISEADGSSKKKLLVDIKKKG